MAEIKTEPLQERVVRGFCPWCGKAAPPEGDFCGDCGKSLAFGPGNGGGQANGNGANGNDAGTPSWMPPTAVHLQQSPLPPNPPYGYPVAYPPPPPKQGPSAGLIIGLVAAALLALGAITAAILLATSGKSNGPTVSTASNVAAIRPNTAGSSPGKAARRIHHPQGFAPAVASPPAASTASSPPPSSAPPVGSAADIAGAQSAVTRHWARINSGDFQGAFSLFVPGYQPDSWIAAHQQIAPISASVTVGTPTFSSATSANVPIDSLRTDSAGDGCATWTGSYDVKKMNGEWLISQANLVKHSC